VKARSSSSVGSQPGVRSHQNSRSQQGSLKGRVRNCQLRFGIRDGTLTGVLAAESELKKDDLASQSVSEGKSRVVERERQDPQQGYSEICWEGSRKKVPLRLKRRKVSKKVQ